MAEEILNRNTSDQDPSTRMTVGAGSHTALEDSLKESGNWGMGLSIGSHLWTWTELSRLNYTSVMQLRTSIMHMQASINNKDCMTQSLRYRSIGYTRDSGECFSGINVDPKTSSDSVQTIKEHFPLHLTPLMNENQYWGCFYLFPLLYGDTYSPVVRIRSPTDVKKPEDGVLTRDIISTSLTYLAHTPILGDFVYIKLDLSDMGLQNIQILYYYKYIVYLDLSTNLLTDISVLSRLLYLQYLSVSFNRLNTVLEYDPPQWFLSEVYYKYNSVKAIRDLSCFWSIANLDLSHNNIKVITGLENLKYLRRLDLSFNHITHLGNLNHLRLLWLDVSYNNISSYDFSDTCGLWTLRDLEYLNLNENNLTSMRVFHGCNRLRELHVRNNRLNSVLEMALYMQEIRRLAVLDLRGNPLCYTPGYHSVAYSELPSILCLDAEEVDPVTQKRKRVELNPDVSVFASRRLLRMLFVEQLQRARVPLVPPADTREVPIVVVVGMQGQGKGKLTRRIAAECSKHVSLCRLHTTASHHYRHHFIPVSRSQFDHMLLDGDFLTYSEINGESYGLSREEAFITDGKVKLVCLDLIGALMLKLRGRRPYMILAVTQDKADIIKKIIERNEARLAFTGAEVENEEEDLNSLQSLLSGVRITQDILDEIFQNLPNRPFYGEYSRSTVDADEHDKNHSEKSADITFEDDIKKNYTCDASLDWLDKDSQNSVPTTAIGADGDKKQFTNTAVSSENPSVIERKSEECTTRKSTESKSTVRKSGDGGQHISIKGGESTRSWKSVTFISQMENMAKQTEDKSNQRYSLDQLLSKGGSFQSIQNDHTIMSLINRYGMSIESSNNRDSASMRDTYESVHLNRAGLFWDTLPMDQPEEAFQRLKRILKDIVNSQSLLKPMFDIDFHNLKSYPTVKERLEKIKKQIAPYQLFL